MKTIRFASALLVALIIGMGFTSCSDDDYEFDDYIVGSWEAENVNLSDQQPNGEIRYVFTFRKDGTGLKMNKDRGTIEERFKYTVESFPEKSGSSLSFNLHYYVCDEEGNVTGNELLGGVKKNGKTWNMTSEYGFTTYYVMHKK